MSDAKAFSLAVVKGACQGRVLRTDRKRISVGTAPDNDFVVDDPLLFARHFMVLIDGGRWRLHTFSDDHDITVDRQWAHPETGKRGAMVHAAESIILLYPGDLEDEVIAREIARRAPRPPAPREVDPSEHPTVRLPNNFAMEAAGLRAIEARLPEVLVDADTIAKHETTMRAMHVVREAVDASAPAAINAWGDPPERALKLAGASALAAQNAWGDPVRGNGSSRALSADAAPRANGGARKNAWGDAENRAPSLLDDQDARPVGAVAPKRLEAHTHTAAQLSIRELAKSTEPALALLRDPDGDLATSIRLLGTRVDEFMRTLGYRAYMLTSPEPLAGKTTSAINLAFALAEDTHRRVALVEANFRHPRFAKILGLPEDQGLIALLEARAQLSEVIAKVADRNLVILPSGGRHPSPSELIASPRFKALIAELVKTVDVAIIDAPSVTPFADANLLLPMVDAAFLVVSEGQTRATWLAEAGTQIGGTRVLGAVYNRVAAETRQSLLIELKERLHQDSRAGGPRSRDR